MTIDIQPMNIQLILNFLKEIAANNNRPWFQEHKAEYERAKHEFEDGVQLFIKELSAFDSEITHLTPRIAAIAFIAT